jgi:hypothetical protein
VEKRTCRITRTRIAAYWALLVAFRLVSGRNWAIFSRPPPMYWTPLRRMFNVPPPCSSGLSSAAVSTSRNFADEPAAFNAFAYGSGWGIRSVTEATGIPAPENRVV